MDIRTLVITVLPNSEAKAVRAVFALDGPTDESGEYPVFYYPNGHTAVSCVVNKGNFSAAVATDRLLDRFKPQRAILVGTCAGRPDKTRIGDVVLSQLGVMDYGQSPLVPDEPVRLISTGAPGALARQLSLLNSDSRLKETWWPAVLQALLKLNLPIPEGFGPAFYGKAIASGSQIINETSMGILTRANENIYAADQDTAGFAAACGARQVDWAAVRGVSDCGDRDTRKGNAEFAAIAAAAAVKLFLDADSTPCEDIESAPTHVYTPKKKSGTSPEAQSGAVPEGGLPPALGCTHIWAPSRGREAEENQRRNEAKRADLAAGAGRTIRLLAETGYSFLSGRGIFYGAVKRHLEDGGAFHIVLADPATENILCTEPERRKINRKYEAALDDYMELKEEFADLICLKTVPMNLPATIFIANAHAYYEPYIHLTAKREKLWFVSFEMLFEKGAASHGYDLMLDYFNRMYARGKEYTGRRGSHAE